MHPSTNLQRVTITGADDRTDISEMQCLAAEFPFLEWAILYGLKVGPRNPSLDWQKAFFAADIPCAKAVHLCGIDACRELMTDRLPEHLHQADRLQININARADDFVDEHVVQAYEAALPLWSNVVVQWHSRTQSNIQTLLERHTARDDVHVLLDSSKGKGIVPAAWEVPVAVAGQYCGFAGGLGPHNVATVLAQLEPLGRPYWIDMETHVRTGDALDLRKVRKVLELAQRCR